MNNKHNAIWVDSDGDDAATIVSEIYSPELDKLFVVYLRSDGRTMPFSYVKLAAPQWSLPFWSRENDKVLMDTLEDAMAFLENFGAKMGD